MLKNFKLSLNFSEIKVFHEGAELFLENTEQGVMVTVAFHGIITTQCRMKFAAYPFDTQKCKFMIGTDTATVEDLVFSSTLTTSSNVKTRDHGEVGHFREFSVSLNEVSANVTWNKLASLGTKKNLYNVIGFEIILSRIGTPYMLSYFLPAFGMSCIGSMSFLIMPESVPGRIALLLTLMLLLISFFNAIQVSFDYLALINCQQTFVFQNQIPKSDGLTAIGFYLLATLAMVFLALFEYAIILFRMKRRQINKMNSTIDIRINKKKLAWNESHSDNGLIVDYKIDQFAFIIYISILIFFNFCYWVTFGPSLHG